MDVLRTSLRVAMLTHSVNPRGGVVHALQLAESLQALGHDVTLFAPDARGKGLFRPAACHFQPVPGPVQCGDVAGMVRQRIDDYLRCFEQLDMGRFDICHAQDSISANALATLAERGVIGGYVRTVHHLDQFDDARLHAWQERGYREADLVLCVSRTWQDILLHEHGVRATLVSNGVDMQRYTPEPTPRDQALRHALGLIGAPLLLAVGGVEPRKNTLGILQAFVRLRRVYPQAQLVIAGGASVLDHAHYQHAFQAELEAAALPAEAVRILGQVDDADMPSLFRCADVLVFPSLKEGFGLVVLEAMASGVPVVVSRIAPFTEYLDGDCCAWVDPTDPASVAAGIAHALDPTARAPLIAAGREVCARFAWQRSARRHADLYADFISCPRWQRHSKRNTMPEMHFRVRWPDDTVTDCYSPSLVVKEHLEAGRSYPLAEFVQRSATALNIGSERVREKYGFACSSALDQLRRIEELAARFEASPDPVVRVESFTP